MEEVLLLGPLTTAIPGKLGTSGGARCSASTVLVYDGEGDPLI